MRPFASSLVLLLLFASSVLQCTAQKDNVDEFIEKEMQRQRIVGLSIGIIKNGKVVKSKGYGYANLEYKIPATENTVFKLASVSKHMVASGIMLLMQEGKLKLNDPVTKYFKEAPSSWNAITIRHLLNHTSGLRRESPRFQSMLIQSDSVLIRAAYNEALVFPTGSSWQYCNLGYFMLADIIRQLSGQSFSQFMKNVVFNKCGMTHTQTTDLRTIVPDRAGGYVRRNGDTILNAENNIALRPSGAFLSSISDMLKWEMIMQNNQMLNKQNWQQMWEDTVYTNNLDEVTGKEYYGYGWTVARLMNRNLVSHGGSLQGFRTIYFRFPAEKTAIIILTNTEPVATDPIAAGVAKILFKD